MRKVLGVLFLLGMLACLFFAYMEAGGMHGSRSFDVKRLLRGDALTLTLGAGACLMIALVALFSGGKKKA